MTTPPTLGDLEEPLNALEGIAGTLNLMGLSDLLDEEDRVALSWLADRLIEVTKALRNVFDGLHDAVAAEKREKEA